MPISFSKTFKKSDLQPHYYVFNHIFILYDDALNFCEENSIPFEFIVKTKFYINL